MKLPFEGALAQALPPGCIQQRHDALPGQPPGQRLGGPGGGQLRAVAGLELLEPGRIMPELASRLGAGRDVLAPFIEVCRLLRDPTRPEPVHEHAVAVLG